MRKSSSFLKSTGCPTTLLLNWENNILQYLWKCRNIEKYLGFSYLITSCIIKLDILHKENLIQSWIVERHKNINDEYISKCQSWSVLCILFLVCLFLQFSCYSLSTMSKSTISWHVSLIVKYLEEDVVQNEIIIIINNVEEFDIVICNINCKICWGGCAPEWKSKKINQN